MEEFATVCHKQFGPEINTVSTKVSMTARPVVYPTFSNLINESLKQTILNDLRLVDHEFGDIPDTNLASRLAPSQVIIDNNVSKRNMGKKPDHIHQHRH